MKPTLFVGFGGTGAFVLQKAKYALAKHFHNMAGGTGAPTESCIPACFSFLAVDIDESAAAVPKGYESAAFPLDRDGGSEFFSAALGGSFSSIENSIKNQTEPAVYPAIKQWWPEGLGEVLVQAGYTNETPDQAYQIRQVGRLAFWTNASQIEREISRRVHTLSKKDTVLSVKTNTPGCEGLVDGAEVDICVVASAAGGTGCGMLLDGLALINKLKEKGDVSLFLLLPSCYKAAIQRQDDKDGLVASQVNAYALLKELSGLATENCNYVENIGELYELVYNKPLTYTYLVSDVFKGGLKLDGEGKDAAESVANFIIRYCIDWGEELNKAAGRAARVKTIGSPYGWTLPYCYSAFGVSDFAYPHDEMTRYAESHYISTLAYVFEDQRARHTDKSNRVSEDIVDSDLATVTTDEVPQWPEWYESAPRARNAPCWFKTLVPSYKSEKSSIENSEETAFVDLVPSTIVTRMLNARKDALDNLEKGLQEASQSKSHEKDCVRRQFSEFINKKWYGVLVARAYLSKLASDAKSDLAKFEGDLADARQDYFDSFKSNEDIGLEKAHIANKLQFRGTRLREVRILLQKLQKDVQNQRKVCQLIHIVESVNRVIEACEYLETQVDALIEEARKVGKNKAQERDSLGAALVEAAKRGEWFGCNEDALGSFLQDFTRAAEEKLSDLCLNVCTGDIAWPELLVSEWANDIIDEKHKNEGFLERFRKYVNQINAPLFKALSEKVKMADPMVTIKGALPDNVQKNYYLLGNFTKDQLDKACNYKSFDNFVCASSIDKNAIACVALIDGLSPVNIGEVTDLFGAYKCKAAIPRADRFAQLSAHILREVHQWNDLVGPDLGGRGRAAVEVGNEITNRRVLLAQELGMLKKDAKGSWWRYDKDGQPQSRPMQGPNAYPYQWPKKSEAVAAFHDAALVQDFEKAAIDFLAAKYNGKREEYAAFRAKQDEKTKLPILLSKIDEELCKRFGWKFS